MITLTIRLPGAPPQTLDIDRAPVTLGRAPGNSVVLSDGRISSFHGQIARRGSTWVYADLGSRNGSVVDAGDRRVTVDGREVREAQLPDGARILLGDANEPVIIEVSLSDAAHPPTETVVATRAAAELSERSVAWLDARADRRVLRHLVALAEQVAAGRTQVDAIRPVADAIFELAPAAEALLWVPLGSADEEAPRVVAVRDAGVREARAEDMPVSRSMLARLRGAGEALLWGEHGDHRAGAASLARIGVRSAAAAPVGPPGAPAAALVLHAAPQRTLDEAALDLLVVLSRQVGGALLHARRSEALEREASDLRTENGRLRVQIADAAPFPRILGSSAAMLAVFQQMRAVAPSTTTVLVLGETGTGKELVARSLHEASPRGARRFAAVNCAALSDTLLDGELFGHVRGAFTGADRDRQGLFEAANGGTLFLDEIGEISPALQVKLLRVLQEGEVMPVGATSPRKVDVRIVAATNRDLAEEVAAGRFRADLYYRVHVFPIRLPPLRDRGRDIALLARSFLDHHAARLGRHIPGLSDAARDRLLAWTWPGNIRELANEMERAALLAPEGQPLPEGALSDRLRHAVAPEPERVGDLHATMERLEKQVVLRALEQNEWNRTQTAKAIGISRQALQVKLAKWGMRPD